MAEKLTAVDARGHQIHVDLEQFAVDDQGNVSYKDPSLHDIVQATPQEPVEQPVLVRKPPRVIIQAHIDADTRTVVGFGEFRPAAHHADDDGNPTIEGGLGHRAGCVIEEISPETKAAIEAALPEHGGGVALSADHATITPNPEPPHVAVQAAAMQQRAADLALITGSSDPAFRALARLLGVAPA